jgi:putative ABC transport system permease protein
MWRNYLTVGLRALMKSKTYAFINILGLALGLAACLMLLLYVRYERSYDQWLPNGENVYQLQTYSVDQETGDQFALQMSPYVSAVLLKQDFPEVEAVVNAYATFAIALRNGEALSVADAFAVNGPLFDILQLPFVRGDPRTALDRPGNLVLTETQARRLFGEQTAEGRWALTAAWRF